MVGYTLRRAGLALAVVALVVVVLFVLVHAIPGDPARIALGPRATAATIAAYRTRMGLDLPVPAQIARFFQALLRGDLGTDVLTGRPVASIVFAQLPFTLALIAVAIGWAVLLGVPLGCLAALRRGGWFDRISGVLSVSVIAMPSFLIAIYALLLLAIDWHALPAIGPGQGFGDELVHLVLPSLALGLSWVGYLARLVRSAMLEALGEPHIRTARAFGLKPARIVAGYALRLALPPTVTVLGLGIGQMFSDVVFAEIIFARPGVGKLVYDAVLARDYPMVAGTVLVTALLYVLVNLTADLIVAWLDPRARRGIVA
jgi:peptide/nickel transport system permease protein